MRGSGQHPEDGAKHQNGAGQAKFSGHFQVVAVGVVDEEIEKSGLNGRISYGKGTQPGSEERMAAHQAERIAPDRNAALTAEKVFTSHSFEPANYGMATAAHDAHDDNTQI